MEVVAYPSGALAVTPYTSLPPRTSTVANPEMNTFAASEDCIVLTG